MLILPSFFYGTHAGTLKQYEKAIFMYETAIQHNPKCAEAYNNLGVIYKVIAKC